MAREVVMTETPKPADLNIRGLLDTIKALRRFEAMCLLDLMKFTPDQVVTFNSAVGAINLDRLNELADNIYSQPDIDLRQLGVKHGN